MKEIKAFIQPFKLDEVVAALQTISGVQGITVTRGVGFGNRRLPSGLQTPAPGAMNYVAKEILIVIVADTLVDSVLAMIEKHAHTGNYGDGLAYVCPVEDVVRLRTGDRGENAL